MLIGTAGYTAARITNTDIASNAGISFSKLAALNSGNMLVGNGSNVATAVTPGGEVTMDNAGSFGLSNAAVIGKVLTGFSSGAGTVSASDSILQAINKIVGNISGKISTTLNSAQILVGNASNIATAVTPGGSVTMDNTGAFVIGASKVTNSMLAGSIDLTSKVTNTLPLGSGGTGQTTATAAFDALAACSTQGAILYYNGTHWVCLNPGTSGQLLQTGGAAANPSWITSSANPAASEVTVDSGNGYGSTNTSVRRYTNIRKNVGSDITYADSATAGGTFTINTTGRYAVSRHDGNTGTMGYIGIVVNGTALSSAVGTLTYAQGVRALAGGAQSGVPEPVTWTGNLTTGDVIYMQDAGNTACNFTDARSMVTVARLN